MRDENRTRIALLLIILGNMTENLQADCVQSRQAGFVRCCLYSSTTSTVTLTEMPVYRRISAS